MKDGNFGAKTVSLIFPNWNGKDLTLDFLESLKNTNYKNFEIIIVDNGSTDGSVRAIREKFPEVKIIENRENLGLTKAYNQGIKLSRGDYVLMLDNDMIAHNPHWIDELVKTAESDDKIGAVVPERLYYYDTAQVETIGGIRQTVENYGRYKFSKFVYKLIGAPLFVTGVSLMKKNVLDEVGPFDEDIFFAFCDVDLHYRMTRLGYKVVYQPKSNILHKGHSTMRKKTYTREYERSKERVRLIMRRYPPLLRPFTITITLVYYTLMVFYYLISRRPDLSKSVLDGVAWNIRNWRQYV